MIGTSNGVFQDGYVQALEECGAFRSFANFSVGGCSAELAAYRLTTFDLSQFDVCVLELGCNDGLFLRNGETSVEHVELALFDAVAKVLDGGALPALLLMPIQQCIPSGDEIRAIFRRVSAKLQAPLFDGYSMLEQLAKRGINPHDLFVDKVHLVREVAYAFGEAFAVALTLSLPASLEFRPARFARSRHTFLPATGLGLAADRVAQKKTALLASDIVNCEAGDRLTVPTPPGTRVTAVVFDAASSCSVIELTGWITQRFRLTTEMLNLDGGPLRVTVWPAHWIRGEEGAVSVSFLRDGPTTVQRWWGPPQRTPPVAGLIGVVVGETPQPSAVPIPIGIKCDLNAQLPQQRYADLAKDFDISVEERIVISLYRTLLTRSPDPIGLEANVNILREQDVTEGVCTILSRILASDEYRTRHGGGPPMEVRMAMRR